MFRGFINGFSRKATSFQRWANFYREGMPSPDQRAKHNAYVELESKSAI